MPRILEALERLRDPRYFPAPASTEFDVRANGRLITLRADLDDPRFTADAIVAELDGCGIRGVIHTRTPEGDLAWIDANFGGWHAVDLAASESVALSDDRGLVAIAGFETAGRPLPWLRTVRQRGDGIVGPVLVASRAGELRDVYRRLLLATAFAALRLRGYMHALVHGLAADADLAAYERDAGARVVASYDLATTVRRRRTALLSSSCSDYIAHVNEQARSDALPIDVVGMVTCTPDEYHREYAAARGISPAVVPRRLAEGETREAFGVRVAEALRPMEPEFVALLGWDYLLPQGFIDRFPQLVNLHGAYLPFDPNAEVLTDPNGREMPAIRGLHPTQDAFAAKLRWSGSTLHRVTAEVDRGEVLVRTPVPLDRAETAENVIVLVAAGALRTASDGILRWTLETD